MDGKLVSPFCDQDEAVHIGQGWGSVNLGPGWAGQYGTLWAKDLMCHFQAEDGWDGEWTRRLGTPDGEAQIGRVIGEAHPRPAGWDRSAASPIPVPYCPIFKPQTIVQNSTV
eukprot:jgi/Botrbrau1/23001/Bobra.0030s0065.1